jgi:hypothetical protein
VLTLGENELSMVDDVKDLGIIMDNKFTLHINRMIAKAFNRSNLILKCFCRKMLRLSFALLLFTLGLHSNTRHVHVWSPYRITDINRIESVQRKFTKRLPGFALLNYKERLLQLKMETLESRRLRQDLLLAYKILFGLVDTNPQDFFTIANSGHDT